MELRNVKITIQQAANWYSSNNDTLKALALSAFSRDELILYYIKAQSKTVSLDLPLGQIDKFKTLAQLSLLASYLNSITKIEKGTKYFLGKNDGVDKDYIGRDSSYIYDITGWVKITSEQFKKGYLLALKNIQDPNWEIVEEHNWNDFIIEIINKE